MRYDDDDDDDDDTYYNPACCPQHVARPRNNFVDGNKQHVARKSCTGVNAALPILSVTHLSLVDFLLLSDSHAFLQILAYLKLLFAFV